MDAIHLILVTSGGERWEHMVCSVTLPAVNGSLGILRGHAPMLCAVSSGLMKCRCESGESFRVRISDGIANVADNEVTLLLEHLNLEN